MTDLADAAMAQSLAAALAADANRTDTAELSAVPGAPTPTERFARPACRTSHSHEKTSHYTVRHTINGGVRVLNPSGFDQTGHDVFQVAGTQYAQAIEVAAELRVVDTSNQRIMSWAVVDTVFLCGCRY